MDNVTHVNFQNEVKFFETPDGRQFMSWSGKTMESGELSTVLYDCKDENEKVVGMRFVISLYDDVSKRGFFYEFENTSELHELIEELKEALADMSKVEVQAMRDDFTKHLGIDPFDGSEADHEKV